MGNFNQIWREEHFGKNVQHESRYCVKHCGNTNSELSKNKKSRHRKSDGIEIETETNKTKQNEILFNLIN